MADFGSPVAAGVNSDPTRGLKTISDLMGLQQQKQAIQGSAQKLQLGDVEVQKAQQANTERLNLQQFTQDPQNWQTNGQIDMGKINALVPKLAPYTGADYITKMSTLSTAQTGAAAATQNLTQAQRAIVAGPIGVLGRAGVTDPAAYATELENLKTTNPDNPHLGSLIDSYKTMIGMTPPGPHVAQAAVKASQSLLGPDQQQAQLSPTATTVGLGGQVSPAIVTPAIGGNQPSVQIGQLKPNEAAAVTPPPTTEVVDPVTGAKHLIGQPGQLGPATTLPIGAESGVASNVADMNTHFSGLQNASQGAALISGLTGNVKALAQKAVTGTEADRQAYVNGLLNTLGVGDKISGNLQTDTDLLHKQLAQINTNTKASTDAAQTLVNAAQPNSHMNATAMGEAADQIASQVQLNMAIRNKLSSLKYANNGQGNAPDYQAMRQKIEAVADPRALQWQNLGPGSPEAKAYVQGLKPADQKALRKSVAGMRELGIM